MCSTNGIHLQPEYAYVMLTAMACIIQMIWLSMKSAIQQPPASILTPNVVATRRHSELLSMDADDPTYEPSRERSQQVIPSSKLSSYEIVARRYNVFMTVLMLGGLRHPIIATVGGLIWTASACNFVNKYGVECVIDKDERTSIWKYYIAELVCLICTMSGAIGLLGFI